MPGMRDPATGQIVEVAPDQVEQAIRAGFVVEGAGQQFARIEQEVAADRVAGPGAALEAVIAGGLRGATFGISDAAVSALGTGADVERLAELRRGRPIASLIGEVGGGVATALASGGTGALGQAARLTPSGALAQVSGRVLGLADEAGTLGRVAAGVGAGALEGAAGGAGTYLTQVALEDKPLAAEGFLASMHDGAMWGGAAGGALAAGERAFVAARKLFPKAGATRQAVEAAERTAVDEVDAALRDSDALEGVARQRIDEIVAMKRATDPALDAELRAVEAAAAARAPAAIGGTAGSPLPPGAIDAVIAPPPQRLLDDDEIGMLISGRGRVRGGRVTPNVTPDSGVDLEAQLAATLEGTPRGPRRTGIDPDQARRLEMRERAKETLAAAKRAREGGPAAVPAAAGPSAGRIELADQATERAATIGDDLTALTGRPTRLEDLTAAYAPPEGWGVRFDKAGPAPGARGGVSIEGDIIAPDGNIAGFVGRTLRRGDDGALEIVHSDLQLYPGYWNHGVGPAISRSALEAYPKLGIERIEIPNAMHIGRYYWQRQGYRANPDHIGSIVDGFKKWLARDADLASQSKELARQARAALKKPGGMTSMEVGGRKIGKEFLLSKDAPDYGLTLSLKPGDPWYQAVKRHLGIEQAPQLSVVPDVAGPTSALERQLGGTLQHVRAGGDLGAAPHVAGRQALDAIDEVAARLDPEARVLIDASRDLRMSAAEIREWVGRMRARGGAGTLPGSARRGGPPSAAEAAAPLAAPAAPESAGDAVATALRIPARDPADVAEDIADNLGRFEAANANIADALGPAAPPTAAARAAALRQAEAQTADSTARATAEAADDLARKDTGGMLSTVADLGAAYEVMRAMGVPLPSPSRIPVIGPLVGLYFKARAAATVFRRLGGKVPVTAEAMIARGAAASRERVYRAVDGMLGLGERAARGARAAQVPRWSGVLAQRLIDDGTPAREEKGPDPDAANLRARVDELARSAQPGVVRNVIRQRFPLADPALVDELTASMERRLAYLRQHAPLVPVAATMLRGGRSDWSPSRAEILSFARRMEAADNPAAVLERAAETGDLSIEGAETIRAVYPRLFQDAQMRLVQRAAELKETLPYGRRVMLSLLFDVPLDGTTDPEYVAFLQSGFQPSPPAAAAPAPGMPPAPSISADVNASGRAMLRTDQPLR